MEHRCFACNRIIKRKEPFLADTRDDQVVFVGPECHKLIAAAGESGYQPPKGGPKLYPVESFIDWAGQIISCRFVSTGDDAAPVGCEINPHGDGWTQFGRGKTSGQALESARREWNIYDQHS